MSSVSLEFVLLSFNLQLGQAWSTSEQWTAGSGTSFSQNEQVSDREMGAVHHVPSLFW